MVDPVTLQRRITEYLSNGGLFNPEYMDHDKVRDLLIDCRDALQSSAPPTGSGVREALIEYLREVEEYLNCHGDRKAEALKVEARGWRVTLQSSD